MLCLAPPDSAHCCWRAGAPAEAAGAEAQPRAGAPVATRRLPELAGSGTLGSPASSSELLAASHGTAPTAGAPTAAYLVLVLPAWQPATLPLACRACVAVLRITVESKLTWCIRNNFILPARLGLPA